MTKTLSEQIHSLAMTVTEGLLKWKEDVFTTRHNVHQLSHMGWLCENLGPACSLQNQTAEGKNRQVVRNALPNSGSVTNQPLMNKLLLRNVAQWLIATRKDSLEFPQDELDFFYPSTCKCPSRVDFRTRFDITLLTPKTHQQTANGTIRLICYNGIVLEPSVVVSCFHEGSMDRTDVWYAKVIKVEVGEDHCYRIQASYYKNRSQRGPPFARLMQTGFPMLEDAQLQPVTFKMPTHKSKKSKMVGELISTHMAIPLRHQNKDFVIINHILR
jgi:hypothetical protein